MIFLRLIYQIIKYMKLNNSISLFSVVLVIILSFASCNEDFSEIGIDILNGQEIQGTQDNSKTVIAYSRKLLPVATSNMPVYQLGVYNDPVYGKTTANFLTQISLSNQDPTFAQDEIQGEIVVDSVYLYLPFFSTIQTQDETNTYVLDSVFGNQPINISVYESTYYLNTFDPNTGFEESQKYYSNQQSLFESHLSSLLVNETDFTPSNEEIILRQELNEDETNALDTLKRLKPGIRVALDNAYFKEKIIDKEGELELFNQNNFKDYFRGIYFKASSNNDDGTMFLFKTDEANITISYHYQIPKLDEEDNPVFDDQGNPVLKTVNKNYTLTLSGVQTNVFENTIPSAILGDLASPNTAQGEENLYIKGGDGIMTIIELFGPDNDQNGIADELDELRTKNWLINEANLIFYVNQDMVTGGDAEPDRVFLYDLKNNAVLEDFSRDYTINLLPNIAINKHLGILERGSDNNGEYYKIRITNHITNLINKDSTNVPLGLVVSQNVMLANFNDLKEEQSPLITKLPVSSIVAPKGTVLYGNTATNEEKKLKLQIYYTEPN